MEIYKYRPNFVFKVSIRFSKLCSAWQWWSERTSPRVPSGRLYLDISHEEATVSNRDSYFLLYIYIQHLVNDIKRRQLRERLPVKLNISPRFENGRISRSWYPFLPRFLETRARWKEGRYISKDRRAWIRLACVKYSPGCFSHEILEAVVLAISRKVFERRGVLARDTGNEVRGHASRRIVPSAVKDHAGAPFVFRPATPSITFLGKTSRL